MRAYEFIIEILDISEVYDIGEHQLRLLHKEFLRTKPKIYESLDSYQTVTSFLDKFEKTPIIGKEYLPISVVTIPAGQFISLSVSEHIGELVRTTENHLIFNFGKGERPFPFNLAGADQLSRTVLCESSDEQNQFMSWVYLTFESPWRITRHNL